MKWNKIIQYVIFTALAIVLLYFSFRGIRWADFVDGLRTARLGWIAASALMGILGFYFRAARWRYLLLPLDSNVKRLHAFDGVNIGYLTNFALPRAGEFARCGVISTTSGTKFNNVLGTVVTERAFDLFCMLAATVIVVLLRLDLFGGFMKKQILAPLLERTGGSATMFVLVCLAVLLIIILVLWMFRRKLRTLKIYQKITQFLKGVWKGMISCLSMPHKTAFLLLTLGLWGSYALTSYFTILAFPTISMNFVDALFLMVVGSFGWAVPVQGGFGSFHFIVSLALVVVYGLSQTQGVVFATIAHEVQAVCMLLCGIFSSLHYTFIKRKL